MAQKAFDNHLGIKGWAIGGSWGIERYLYTLHRITGLGILLYFLMHIFVTSARVFGSDFWNILLGENGFLHHTVFVIGEYLVYVAFCFHALNGIRLVMIELGFLVGKPIEPVYPYKTCLHLQRPLTMLFMVVSAFLIVVGGYDLFIVGK